MLEQTIRPFGHDSSHRSDTILRTASNRSEELSQDVRIQDLIRRMHREMLQANQGNRFPRDSMDGSVLSDESDRSLLRRRSIAAPTRLLQSSPPVVTKKRTCEICYEEQPEDTFFGLAGCAHEEYCKECLEEHLMTNIKDGNVMQIPCM